MTVRRRADSIRKAARLQSFPDRFVFSQTMHTTFRQIGTAIPAFPGADLDVMIEGPLTPDYELCLLKNIAFGPHSAGPTWDDHPKRWRNAFDNCERVARGQKPFRIVPELQ